jgi:hypothetical protein
MSTTNPDEVGRRIGEGLKPFALVGCILAVLFPPIVALLQWTVGFSEPVLEGLVMTYIVLSVVAGFLAVKVPGRRSAQGTAAFLLAYIAGLFLLFRSGAGDAAQEPLIVSLVLIGVPYAIAGVLAVLYLLREAAVGITRESGIDTTAEVLSAPVDGMVNYVQHQRLTLKFTDREGTVRYLRVGRTGGGYVAGDTLPLRYDPARPWSKRSVIIGH